MVLEISIYFEKTISEFWYHFPISFSFRIKLCYFFTPFIEENALNKMHLVIEGDL